VHFPSSKNLGLPPAISEIKVFVLFLAPTRSSSEVKSLLGEDFNGSLSSDDWSAYRPQGAAAKQKCLAYIGRELKGMESSESDE
jgi:hypothetical protein